jgi:hypothetical protein
MITTNSFSSLFIFGDNLNLKTRFINFIDVPKKIIILGEFCFDIYTKGSIDFIFINVDNYDISSFYNLRHHVKNFISNKKYLISNIIYFTTYMNYFNLQLLSILYHYRMKIQFVSLKPTNFSYKLYIDSCVSLNLSTFFIKNITFTKEEFLIIIKNTYCDNYDTNFEYIYDIFIQSL